MCEINSFFFCHFLFSQTKQGEEREKTLLVDPSLDETFIHNAHIGILVHENGTYEIMKLPADIMRTFHSKIVALEQKAEAYTLSLSEMAKAVKEAKSIAEKYFRGD